MGRQKTIVEPGTRDLGNVVNCTVPEFQWKFLKSANDRPYDFWIRIMETIWEKVDCLSRILCCIIMGIAYILIMIAPSLCFTLRTVRAKK